MDTARHLVDNLCIKQTIFSSPYRPYLWICPYCCPSTRGLCQHRRVPSRPQCSCLPQLPLLCLRRIFLGDMKKSEVRWDSLQVFIALFIPIYTKTMQRKYKKTVILTCSHTSGHEFLPAIVQFYPKLLLYLFNYLTSK